MERPAFSSSRAPPTRRRRARAERRASLPHRARGRQARAARNAASGRGPCRDDRIRRHGSIQGRFARRARRDVDRARVAGREVRATRHAGAARVHGRRRGDARTGCRRQRRNVRRGGSGALSCAALSDRSRIGEPRLLCLHERPGTADVRASPRVQALPGFRADEPRHHPGGGVRLSLDGCRRRRGDAGARRRDRERQLLRLLQCATGPRPLLHGAGGLAAGRRRRHGDRLRLLANGIRRSARRARQVDSNRNTTLRDHRRRTAGVRGCERRTRADRVHAAHDIRRVGRARFLSRLRLELAGRHRSPQAGSERERCERRPDERVRSELGRGTDHHR